MDFLPCKKTTWICRFGGIFLTAWQPGRWLSTTGTSPRVSCPFWSPLWLLEGISTAGFKQNQVRKLQIVYRLGVAGGPLPVPVANEGLEDSLLKIRIILPMAPVTGRGPHRIYMCLMCLKQFLVKMWTHNFIFDFQICADHSMTSYLCFWTSSKFARKWWSWVRKPMDLRTSARLFTTFVEVDDLPLQLTMQLGMT